ncbi:hypothetical protein Y032_0003g1612 [Ancylostoma ceylanicum]|uniref:Uncharacterized protein n=1 Tax=Ancylostoma ceylanicum TaxID=53326 RepID=A0A016VYM6_9BILA|nr:hypothetical protein Y032_0003g1612 [Ancylostoma ceylanicum]
MAREFFPTGKMQCPLPGMLGCTMSIGVWGHECCGKGKAECCGYISVAGYIAIGVVAALIILLIIGFICKKA